MSQEVYQICHIYIYIFSLSEIQIVLSIHHFYLLKLASCWQSQTGLSDSQAKICNHCTNLLLSLKIKFETSKFSQAYYLFRQTK